MNPNPASGALPALRPARSAEAAALAALVNSAYRGDSSRAGWTTEADLLGGQRTDPAALAEFIRRGEAENDRVMLVHDSAERITACVQLDRHADHAYLGMLTIEPGLQAAGLGRGLLAAAEEFVRRRWRLPRVVMTVIEQRPELIAWYERRGYRRTGETAAFPYGDPRFGEPKRDDLRFVLLEKTLPPAAPLVIAHRGASGYRPEHTLESYRLAIEMGADFIEPDLVSTRDGHLVARHEPEIGSTTDVASRAEFAARKRTLRIDGQDLTGWFTTDFTLAELRTLRAIQPRADRTQRFNGLFQIPTLDEIIDLARRESAARGRTIGIYPETKHPTWHCELGLPLEPRLLATLDSVGWTRRDSPVFIQSFESGNLRWLQSRTAVRLVQLLDGGQLCDDGSVSPCAEWSSAGGCSLYPQGSIPRDYSDPATFQAIRNYADAVGPWKRHLIGSRQTDPADTTERTRRLTPPTRFVEFAHAAGLEVHPWTFRNEAIHLAADYAGDPAAEYRQFAALGVDALFSDFPDTAVAALRAVAALPQNL
ncbi:MAG: GNAT family N-acetyltransferase [Gammaproteobacteria bacterium]|nr:GNAT family N-acetyltransferase [Gammaproteobacteria bacterium]